MEAFGANLIIKPIYKTKTDGGLDIPESEYRDPQKVHVGEVVSVGDGKYLNNKVEMNVAVGDKVFYRGSSGVMFKYEDAEHKILQITDVLAKEYE